MSRIRLDGLKFGKIQMPWREPNAVPFTRIGIVSQVPSEAGVYAISDGPSCIFVGESWNLKARLLELANVLTDISHLTIMYELCSEDQLGARKRELTAELLEKAGTRPPSAIPGLLLRSGFSITS
ncbi:MAG TPA: hypothetical protein VEQ63_09985 [Bryobacteraceae bacterium]|nr:hypothetical protein [Bryobacteraceae bacterium]